MSFFKLKLDLQFFSADGGGDFGGYDPSTAYEGIGANEPQVQPEGQGEPFQPQQPQEPQNQILDFGGRKLQANEDLAGLHKDFTEQQRYITSLQEQVNAYKQLSQQVQAQPQQQAQPTMEQQAQTTMNNWGEDEWSKFYDNGPAMIAEIAQQIVQQQLAETVNPIIEERKWNEELQNMHNQYPDFQDYAADIQALIEQDGRYAQDGGLENAYFRAKATRGFQVSPNQMAQNPQVQQQVMNNYFENKQQVNQSLPTTMGRGAGGFTAQTPEYAPTTLREASKGVLKTLGLR